jgi:hypothetical protein
VICWSARNGLGTSRWRRQRRTGGARSDRHSAIAANGKALDAHLDALHDVAPMRQEMGLVSVMLRGWWCSPGRRRSCGSLVGIARSRRRQNLSRPRTARSSAASYRRRRLRILGRLAE